MLENNKPETENGNYQSEKNKIEPRTLYLVATPIGNLSDITERAVKTLREVDFICAEDTRNSLRLLSHLGISKPMLSYHEHNKAERGVQIVARISAGESCALITDAGTPAISDPGEDLVRLCRENGIRTAPIPGACAAVAALCACGLSAGRFVFEGFLPVNRSDKAERLNELRTERRTAIIYEAPHKLKTTLTDLCDALGSERRLSVCRELTKLNEEIFTMTLNEAVGYYKEKEPRGEFVLVLEGADDRTGECFWQKLTLKEHVEFYMAQGMSKMDAIKATASDRKIPKNTVYKEMLD